MWRAFDPSSAWRRRRRRCWRRVEEAGVGSGRVTARPRRRWRTTTARRRPPRRALLTTSKRLKERPKTANAMRKGELSPAKAEAIADAATVAPEAEDALLARCRERPARRAARAVLEGEGQGRGRDAQADPPESVRAGVQGRRRRLEPARPRHGRRRRAVHDDVPAVDRRALQARQAAKSRIEPIEACAFDALMELADRAGDTSPDAETSAKPKRKPAKYRGVAPHRLRDPASAVRPKVTNGARSPASDRSRSRGPASCSGDAILELVITKVSTSPTSRTWVGRRAVAQQVALWWSARACQRIDCTRTERLENDHREEWHKVHETCLDNLDPLCPHDHWLKIRERSGGSTAPPATT